MIDISIVIANINTKDLILGCLRSIQKNVDLKRINFEVLVTDDGSVDGSVEELKELKKDRFWKNRLTLTFSKHNLGYVKANNISIRKAKGKYILLLNSDTLVHKNAVEELFNFAQVTPDAGVVGSKLLNIDGSLQMSCYNFPTLSRAIREYFFGQKGLFEKFAPKGKEPSMVDSVVGASFLITPKAKETVGLLDERYRSYFEDIDYCRQTWKKGLKVYYLPSSIITHYHGASFNKMADEKEQWKKLIPSSKIYHGFFNHYLINFVIWIGQKWQKILGG